MIAAEFFVRRETLCVGTVVSYLRRLKEIIEMQLCFDRPALESARSGVHVASCHMAEEPEERDAARRLKEIQALRRSNAALRCLLSLQSRRTAADSSRNIASRGEPVAELSERFERLIEAVKLLQEDLQLERKKSKLLLSRQFYADIATFVLFIALSLAVLTIFQPDFPSAFRDYVCSEVDKLGNTIRW